MSEDFVVHVVVGGVDYNGPTLWPIRVVCNQTQLDEGLHYDAAKNWVANNVLNADGLLWACDDKDPAKAVLGLFNWNNASFTKVGEALND